MRLKYYTFHKYFLELTFGILLNAIINCKVNSIFLVYMVVIIITNT